RSAAAGQDPARFHGALLRHRHALLHGALSVALDRKNPPPGQRIFLRGGKLSEKNREALLLRLRANADRVRNPLDQSQKLHGVATAAWRRRSTSVQHAPPLPKLGAKRIDIDLGLRAAAIAR